MHSSIILDFDFFLPKPNYLSILFAAWYDFEIDNMPTALEAINIVLPVNVSFRIGDAVSIKESFRCNMGYRSFYAAYHWLLTALLVVKYWNQEHLIIQRSF